MAASKEIAEKNSAAKEDNDFFGEDDDSNDFGNQQREMAAAELAAREARYHNIGYHEGYEAASQERLQEGFQDGYKKVFDAGHLFQIGLLLGQAATRQKIQQQRQQNLPQQEGKNIDASVLNRNKYSTEFRMVTKQVRDFLTTTVKKTNHGIESKNANSFEGSTIDAFQEEILSAEELEKEVRTQLEGLL